MCPCYGYCEHTDECRGEENNCIRVSERARMMEREDPEKSYKDTKKKIKSPYCIDAKCVLCNTTLEIKDFTTKDYFGDCFVKTVCPMCETEQMIRTREINRIYQKNGKDFAEFFPLVDFMTL